MLKCPRDNTELKELKYNHNTVLKCPTCEGLWILKRVVYITMNKLPKIPEDAKSQLRCPHDQTKLSVFHHDGVEIDHCATCGGIWLDAGELNTLLKMIAQRKEEDSSSLVQSGIEEMVNAGAVGDLVFHVI